MKVRYLFFAMSLLLSGVGCSQTNKLVAKAEAFYFVRLPGNVPVDSPGNILAPAADTTHIVYLHTGKGNFLWESAAISNKPYAVSAQRVFDRKLIIGTDKKTQQDVVIKPKSNHQLWRLTFLPNVKTIGQVKSVSGLLIKAKVGNKKFSIPITYKREIVLSELPQ